MRQVHKCDCTSAVALNPAQWMLLLLFPRLPAQCHMHGLTGRLQIGVLLQPQIQTYFEWGVGRHNVTPLKQMLFSFRARQRRMGI